jgi:hypothetical protein
MKRTIIGGLGWVAFYFGLFLALIIVILLFSGNFKVAGVFLVPSIALVVAGSNLREYSKKRS